MDKKVLVISSSLRGGSNSELLAQSAADGASAAGHKVSFVSLKGKNIGYCIGCRTCQFGNPCVLRDDMDELLPMIREADVLVLAVPVYFYSMAGQLKTLLDRCDPMYNAEYRFREVYLITASTMDGEKVYSTVAEELKGWLDCFPKAKLMSVLAAGGIPEAGDAANRLDLLARAYRLGTEI